MLKNRIIPCLDVKDGRVVKGINFVDLVDAGDPVEQAKIYDDQGADELCFLDITASNENRSILLDTVKRTAEKCFMPLTVGGGVRTIEDIRNLLLAGADKVSINTAAVNNPKLIDELVTNFGSANVSLSIEAKKNLNENNWDVYTSNGRDNSKKIVIEWAKEAIERGVGEIFLTSIDNDGFQNGFDSELVTNISEIVSVPLVISGGFGALDHLSTLNKKVSAIAIGSSLHYEKISIKEIKLKLEELGYETRK